MWPWWQSICFIGGDCTRRWWTKKSLMQMTWLHGSMASRWAWSKKQGTRSIQMTQRLTPFAKNAMLNASKELKECQSHSTTTQWSVNSPMPSPPRSMKPLNPTDSVAMKSNVPSTRKSRRKTGPKNHTSIIKMIGQASAKSSTDKSEALLVTCTCFINSENVGMAQ